MIPLIGYGDRLSGRAGDVINFQVSSISAEPFTAALYRSISADPNPAGPGMIEREVPSTMEGSYPSRIQAIHGGSYAIADSELPKSARSFRLDATIWPTLPDKGEQAILSCGEIALILDETGAIAGRVCETIISAGTPLKTRTW